MVRLEPWATGTGRSISFRKLSGAGLGPGGRRTNQHIRKLDFEGSSLEYGRCSDPRVSNLLRRSRFVSCIPLGTADCVSGTTSLLHPESGNDPLVGWSHSRTTASMAFRTSSVYACRLPGGFLGNPCIRNRKYASRAIHFKNGTSW